MNLLHDTLSSVFPKYYSAPSTLQELDSFILQISYGRYLCFDSNLHKRFASERMKQ